MRAFGPHISVNKTIGLCSAVLLAQQQGFSACQLFLGPPQSWKLNDINPDAPDWIRDFKARTGMKLYVHAPYTLHAFAKPENRVKNNKVLAAHIKQAALLNFDGYVVHMGGTKHYSPRETSDVAYSMCSEIGVEALKQCQLLFENCASGNELSGDLEVICQLIDELTMTNSNVGLCLDTCHAWAWGFEGLPWNLPVMIPGVTHDIDGNRWTEEVTLYSQFKQELADHVRLFHLNSAPETVSFGGKYDRHEEIATGVIPKDFFKCLLVDHPEVPVIVERSDPLKVLADQQFVKNVDLVKSER